MLCQKCGKREATTYIKAVVNGSMAEYALCENCAENYNEFIPSFNLSSLLKGFFPDTSSVSEKCPFCGITFSEIVSTGKVGCGHCYDFYYDKLLPSIQRIHGTAVNKGKAPGKAALAIAPQNTELSVINTLEAKRDMLNKAITEQRFEEAAVLRDEIKELEEEGRK